MKIATVDVETFWDVGHSLTKMSPIKYCTHPDTDIISCAFKFDDGPTEVVFGEDEVIDYARQVDWSQYWVVGHNMSGFDAMILAWRMGVRPKMWGCTLAMARPIHAKDVGLSLGALVEHYGLGKKDNHALIATKGKRLKDFTKQEIRDMRKYNADDVDQCYQLLRRLIPQTKRDEVKLIDMTIRMLVEPQFDADTDLLMETYEEESHRKEQVLRELGDVLYNDVPARASAKILLGRDLGDPDEIRRMLMSAKQFETLLTSLGVEVPMKISATTGKEIPALAKTDEAFLALQEHENPLVAQAAAARLDAKSTLLQTRINAFLDAAEAHPQKKVPIPLKYCGADTTWRWSGWGYNPQNLPRINPDKPKPSDALRKSLRAPKGHKVVVADQSGIELRVNHFLWKVPSSMELYQADPEKADLYKDFAANQLYMIPEADVTKPQRQIGKIAQLGLGFQAGPPTFQKVAKLMGGVDIDLEESQEVVTKWRTAYREIVRGWKKCHSVLPAIAQGADGGPVDPWGLVHAVPGGLKTPKGMIRYPELRQEVGDDGRVEWVYGQGRHKARIYAGKINENCLAEGTLVLTDSGWKPIENIERSDLVHDGVEFVRHHGTILKSVQDVINLEGVYMTADHKVLTDGGWKEASQVQRPYRPDVRSADRLEPILQYGKNLGLDVSVRVRSADRKAGGERFKRVETRREAELRVSNRKPDKPRQQNAWHVKAPRVCGLAQHVGALLAGVAPRMEELWWSRYNRLSAVAGFFRGVLGRHGSIVSKRVGLGPRGQRRTLQPRELPLGHAKSEHPKQTQFAARGYPGARQAAGGKQIDSVLQSETRSPSGGASRQAKSHKAKVYDVVNAGPRHRFVVLGANGPFIVHNCVQHLARTVIADNALGVFHATGYRPALTVHDELVYVAPDSEAEDLLAEVHKAMRTPPKWWPELVTWSEGDVAQTYGDAKS